MIRITRARKTDLKAMVKLRFLSQKYATSFDPDLVVSERTPKELEKLTENEFQNPKIIYLLAKENGKPIGLAIFSLSPEIDRIAFLGELYVEKKYRHRGLGTKLVSEAIKIVEKKGLKKFDVSVARKNKLSQKFYHQLGFRPRGWKYLLFEKRL